MFVLDINLYRLIPIKRIKIEGVEMPPLVNCASAEHSKSSLTLLIFLFSSCFSFHSEVNLRRVSNMKRV